MSESLNLDFQIAQLRHMYKQMIESHINAPMMARGLLGPVIQDLEKKNAELANNRTV